MLAGAPAQVSLVAHLLVVSLLVVGFWGILAIPMTSAFSIPIDPRAMLRVAFEEARLGLSEGGIPIGAAIFDQQGRLISSGRNRRVQQGDPSAHGETDAFRCAGRQRSYRDLIMVSTLAPCWYCSGLVRQFGFRTVVVGESHSFAGGLDWLRSAGVTIVELAAPECIAMMGAYIEEHPAIWNEDIGEPGSDGVLG